MCLYDGDQSAVGYIVLDFPIRLSCAYLIYMGPIL
jgi:hypothetical protein